MKHLFLILSAVFALSSCSNSRSTGELLLNANEVATTHIKLNRLEIYCFHGTRQCETCKNMKTNTKAALDIYFSEQLKDSSILFYIIDVDDQSNEKLAEKFQASGTALMVNKVVNGEDSILDWSDFAFEKANESEVFIPEIRMKIETVLK